MRLSNLDPLRSSAVAVDQPRRVLPLFPRTRKPSRGACGEERSEREQERKREEKRRNSNGDGRRRRRRVAEGRKGGSPPEGKRGKNRRLEQTEEVKILDVPSYAEKLISSINGPRIPPPFLLRACSREAYNQFFVLRDIPFNAIAVRTRDPFDR